MSAGVEADVVHEAYRAAMEDLSGIEADVQERAAIRAGEALELSPVPSLKKDACRCPEQLGRTTGDARRLGCLHQRLGEIATTVDLEFLTGLAL
jgi:hypothetical protein